MDDRQENEPMDAPMNIDQRSLNQRKMVQKPQEDDDWATQELGEEQLPM